MHHRVAVDHHNGSVVTIPSRVANEQAQSHMTGWDSDVARHCLAATRLAAVSSGSCTVTMTEGAKNPVTQTMCNCMRFHRELKPVIHPDDVDHLRGVTNTLFNRAQDRLGLSAKELCRLITTSPHTRSSEESSAYEAVASLADDVMDRRALADGIVDGFYSNARKGQQGEAIFAGGVDALVLHGYPGDLINQLPLNATRRFLGLGNVWHGVDPPHDKRVIDVGCGSGVDLAAADTSTAHSAFLVGIDKRPDLLGVAAQACPRASFVVGDITSPPVAGGTFDIVLANGLPPAQRPSTLGAAAGKLHALAVPGGVISATVIIASPDLTAMLAEIYPDEGSTFADGVATLISGKPSKQDLVAAFARTGSLVTLHPGVNPYRDTAAHGRTALVTVTATKG